jgi:hypothetical protein
LVSEYKSGTIDLKGKKLWNLLVGAMSDAGMSEKEFLREICNTIYERINSEALIRRIRAIF